MEHLWGFLDGLRRAGVGAPPDKRADFFRALAGAAPRDVTHLYWYARVTLLADVSRLAAFDRVFDAWFVRGPAPEAAVPPPSDVPAPPGGGHAESTSEVRPGGGVEASGLSVTGGRTFGGSDARQRELMRALHAAWPVHLPVVASRRRRPARSGRRLDPRRTWRQAWRDGGDPTRLRWTARPPRPRRLLVLLDVSGSLRRHTPDLVRLAYTARRAAPARTEVFTFGTRLTRITGALSSRHADPALAVAARAVTDADGGTAIGAALRRFLANPRYLALARGALVVVISDGLERGDPTAMVRATERLSRLGHRLVWWSPLACSPDYRPVTRGMAGVLPHLDRLGGVRDLATGLSEVERLRAVAAGPRRAAHLREYR